jgi:hypothetical protein
MGNTPNVEKTNVIDLTCDDDNYKMDAIITNDKNVAFMSEYVNDRDRDRDRDHNYRYNKVYVICNRSSTSVKIFMLNIKLMDDNILIYVTDTSKKNTKLVHISKVCMSVGTHNSEYLKYIQVSRDFSLISIPENNTINVYNLTKLLNNNTLDFVDTIGITLRQNNNECDHTDRTDRTDHTDHTDHTDRADHTDCKKVLSHSKPYTDFVNKYTDILPHKCILCNDSYIIVCTDSKCREYTNIFFIDYKNKNVYETKLIDKNNKNLTLDIQSSVLKLSVNGKFMVFYDISKSKIFLCDLTDNIIREIPSEYKMGDCPDSICIAEDGSFVTIVTRDNDQNNDQNNDQKPMVIKVYDIATKNIYTLDSKLISQYTRSDIRNTNFHLMDYSQFVEADLLSDECDKLFVLSVFHTT